MSRRLRLAGLSLALILVAACGGTATPSPIDTPVASSPTPSATAGPSASVAPPPATATPPSPSATGASSGLGTERLNVLLVGLDNTTEREHSELTDTLIVASLDPVAQTVSLLALPRDLTDFPLPSGATYREKLNSVYTEIKANPEARSAGRRATSRSRSWPASSAISSTCRSTTGRRSTWTGSPG